ncbi:HTH-type transcriptional regulator MurR [Vibrio crassostreae]|nr:HTH-type transcriptional regulator MurR [Vibrio crassostreae]
MSVINRIMANRHKLPESGKKIADRVINNPEIAMKCNSQMLAKEAQVSQSSIVKFTQKLNFSGFSQFKQELTEELTRKATINQSPLHANIGSEDSSSTIIQKLIKAKNEAIIQTSNGLMVPEFDHVVEHLNLAYRVHIVGMGGSFLSGKDLAYKLLKLGIPGIIEFDSHVQIGIAKTLSPNDIQIVLSFSGNTKEINIAAEVAKTQGATIIALTSPMQSELRTIADICLDTIADESKNRASSITARTAQNVVTDALFIALVKLRGGSSQELLQDIAQQIRLIT